jgi:UDP-N-acetyl-D-mannosaminuronic acid transferase (WecB/TagA/CpsF family)
VNVSDDDVYLAPMYGGLTDDPKLARILEERRPHNVVICLGGGTQEPLGYYLKRQLTYKPAIHCVGAAIGFLSGDQVRIPMIIDEIGLGWLWRSLARPMLHGTRYWKARLLVPLMMRNRDRLPAQAS